MGRIGRTSTPATGAITLFEGRHEGFASGCAVLPGGGVLITAGYDGWLLWHDIATKRVIRRVHAHSFWSWQLAMSHDGRRVATFGRTESQLVLDWHRWSLLITCATTSGTG